jgi:hypothetical protein
MPSVHRRVPRVREMADAADTDARKILAAVDVWAKKCQDLRIESGHANKKVIVRAHPRITSTSKPDWTPIQQEDVKGFAAEVDRMLDRKPEFTLVQKVKNSPALQITFML